MSEDTPEAAPTVSANAANVEFPTDTWGFTRELRKAGLKAAAGTRGDPEKMAVFITTLRTLALHAQARISSDQRDRDERLARIAARSERVYGTGVPVPEPEAAPAEPVVEPETPAA